MTTLTITNQRYELLRQGFKQWLITLGFSQPVVYNHPIYLIEFLVYVEKQGIDDLSAAPHGIVRQYFEYLKIRKNYRRGGTLSNSSINSRIYAVEKFSRYLMKEWGIFLPASIKKLPTKGLPRTILTVREIAKLYVALESDYLGIRDRAMLSLFYGCGLRSKEGIMLNVEDVLLERKLLYVRHTKNYHERLVPMTEQIKQDLENYLIYARPYLLKTGKVQKSLLVSRRGYRPNNSALRMRLGRLVEKSGIASYKSGVCLHSLRHSIGTHLLQKGMKLDDIRQFLGHKSIESTQIYTHIIHEIE